MTVAWWDEARYMDRIVRRPRWVFPGCDYSWAMPHDWMLEHRDPLIGREPDPDPKDPYRAWREMLAAMNSEAQK